ncbi:hypothetical protein HFO02_12720 [Rhizobium laguerreae]|uniref:hypothetical protein n=1 Tax=Rhizobium laguerreae TaxID=1076926 RepID=UPI001C90559A|nr:hypothetical protein [Rhizobium laguerreae]MBY3324458.1 hypothetical protein [Rhizobium laguerreae]
MLSPELQRRVEEGAQRYRKPGQPAEPSRFDDDLEFLEALNSQAARDRVLIRVDLPVDASHTITVRVD